MTERAAHWMTDGLTARILGLLSVDQRRTISTWTEDAEPSCPLDLSDIDRGHPLTTGRLERTSDRLVTGVFDMRQGTIRGAAIYVWNTYPATLLNAIGDEDAGRVMEWALLSGLRIIDAVTFPAINNISERTRLRLDAPLRPLAPMLAADR